jgi:hypothetical protein
MNHAAAARPSRATLANFTASLRRTRRRVAMRRRVGVGVDPPVPVLMARALADRALGAVRVTCSVRGLDAIARAHGSALASCDVVDRDLPRAVRCVEDDESSAETARADAVTRERAVVRASDAPLYARRKWKAPMRLDVEVGASLGVIESASA